MIAGMICKNNPIKIHKQIYGGEVPLKKFKIRGGTQKTRGAVKTSSLMIDGGYTAQ